MPVFLSVCLYIVATVLTAPRSDPRSVRGRVLKNVRPGDLDMSKLDRRGWILQGFTPIKVVSCFATRCRYPGWKSCPKQWQRVRQMRHGSRELPRASRIRLGVFGFFSHLSFFLLSVYFGRQAHACFVLFVLVLISDGTIEIFRIKKPSKLISSE